MALNPAHQEIRKEYAWWLEKIEKDELGPGLLFKPGSKPQ
jgi:hypothetical protein